MNYEEAQEMVLVTLTVKAWAKTRFPWLPRWMRPKTFAVAAFRGVEIPSWEPVEVPLYAYRALDAYLAGHVGMEHSEIVIHDVGIKNENLPLPEMAVSNGA